MHTAILDDKMEFKLEIPVLKTTDAVTVTVHMVRFIDGVKTAIAQFSTTVKVADFLPVVDK